MYKGQDEFSTLIGSAAETMAAMTKDEGFDTEALYSKIKRASSSLSAGNKKEANQKPFKGFYRNF